MILIRLLLLLLIEPLYPLTLRHPQGFSYFVASHSSLLYNYFVMTTLLQTKFFIPQIRPNLVQRPLLTAKLDAHVNYKLTLISAPAGFGKTTLVSAWISQTEQQLAWLSLDEHDNDLIRFLTYFVAALQKMDSRLGETAVSMLQSPQIPPSEAILTSLINDIAQQPNQLTIVLDDYHLIVEKRIHDGLDFLLEHMPPQLHLIITTRANPPLPLAKLRARGQMQEIRVQSLRFSAEEVAMLFKAQAHLTLSTDDIEALAVRTEGWITGLQLAVISLQEQPDPTPFIQSFTGSNQYILDYLLEEVINQQPPHIQSFLMETAVLTQLSGALCDWVTEQSKSQEILEHLQSINLFLIALDEKREWFRYHHLFADLLRHRLQRTQPDQVDQLHQRASEWYESNGWISAAIHHACATEDYDRAAHLIMQHATQKAYQGESNEVFAWVNNMPEAYVRANPYLSIIKAWHALNLMLLNEAEQHLIQAEQALAQNEDQMDIAEMYGEIFALRAWASHYQGISHQTITYSRQALAHLPSENVHARSLILGPLAGALMDEGQTEAAMATYQEAVEAYRDIGNWLALVGIVVQLCDIYIICGQLRQAASFTQAVLDSHSFESSLAGQIHCGLGIVYYEKYELETAVSHLQQSVTTSDNKTIHLYAYYTLAKIYAATAEKALLQTAVAEAETIITQNLANVPQIEIPMLNIQAALLMNDVTRATQLQQTHGISTPAQITYHNEVQALIFARLLLAQGRAESSQDKLNEVVQLLEMVEETAVTAKRFARVMEAQMLRALAYAALGKSEAAIELITTALELANREGYRRLFVAEGSPMANLLRRLPESPFIVELLNMMPEPSAAQVNQAALIEPLSERELDVLRLAAQDDTYGEIAEKLFVSLNTVRYHMKNIYTKLDVNKKAQAITKAKELDLL